VQYSEDSDNGENDEGDEEEESDDDYEMRKESAVYGYIHKPEVIEFRGQYYYGQDDQSKYNKPQFEYESHESAAPMVHEPHRVSYIHEHYDEPSTPEILLNKLKKGRQMQIIQAATLYTHHYIGSHSLQGNYR